MFSGDTSFMDVPIMFEPVYTKIEGKERKKLASFWLYNIKQQTFKKLFSFDMGVDIIWLSSADEIEIPVLSAKG